MTTNRDRQLSLYAKLCLENERASSRPADVARVTTRQSMADVAEDLGFAPDEIEAAIDAAIATAMESAPT